MAVITVSRRVGCRGDQIARLVAQELQAAYIDTSVIRIALDRIGAPPKSLSPDVLSAAAERVVNLVAMVWSGKIDHGQPCGDEAAILDREYSEDEAHLVPIMTPVTRDIPRAGNAVIVGRGGAVTLRGHPGAVHVRFTAPREVRIEHVASACRLTREHAAELVDMGDRRRELYMLSHYGVDWTDTALYDLVINTAAVADELAVQWLVQAARFADTQLMRDGLNKLREYADDLSISPFLNSIEAIEPLPLGCVEWCQAVEQTRQDIRAFLGWTQGRRGLTPDSAPIQALIQVESTLMSLQRAWSPRGR